MCEAMVIGHLDSATQAPGGATQAPATSLGIGMVSSDTKVLPTKEKARRAMTATEMDGVYRHQSANDKGKVKVDQDCD